MRSPLRVLLVLALFAGSLSFGPLALGAEQGDWGGDPWSQDHLPSELLVKFKTARFSGGDTRSPLVSAAFDRYLTALGVQAVVATASVGDGPIYRLRFGELDDRGLRAKQEALARDPAIEFAEPNWILATQLTPNDPIYQQGQQWGPQKIGLEQVWDITTGANGPPVTIAMLDTGISRTHPDLAGRLAAGYDFINNDDDPRDDNGHGTFTAGIAGASGNNGVGVVGVSWGVRLMPVKILDGEGRGPVSAFAQGIRYAVDNGAKIVNVSAGIPETPDNPEIVRLLQTMRAAVTYATDRGVVVVAASGNQPNGVPIYPAAYPNVIAVGASTRTDDIAGFSSYGAHVWVAAPGREIVSTYYRDGDTYAQQDGTSASTPFVAGTVALMLAQRGGLTPRAIREILKATAVDILTPGFDPKSGYGRLDTFHATILAWDPPATLPPASISPASGKGTEPFLLTATGFAGNEPVSVWLTAEDGSYRYYRYPSVFANAGAVRVALGTSEPLPAGNHRVTAYGETSRRVATAAFAVTQSVNAQAVQAFARVAPIPDSATKVYFAATGHTLGNAFLRYWQAQGGLAVFGYPISEEFVEVSPTDGKGYAVQYFERNRFEYHPENRDPNFEVLLGLLGRDLTAGRTFPPAPPPLDSTPGRAYFPQTGHALSGEFLQYWQAQGGLAIFGYPISEEFVEVSPTDGKGYTVQYFERNRFELHPENPAPHTVLLGLLGTDSAKRKGYLGP